MENETPTPAAASGFDLSSLSFKAADDGVWFTPVNPLNSKPLPIRLKLLGADSRNYRAAQKKAVNERLRSAVAQASSAGDSEKAQAQAESAVDGVDFMQMQEELLCSCIIAWEDLELKKPVLVMFGEQLECTSENVARVMAELNWLAEQATAFVNKRSNFVGKSSSD